MAGPKEGGPTDFYWNPLWHLYPLLPLLLPFLLFLPKENHRKAAWTVLIPLAVTYAALTFVETSVLTIFGNGALGSSIAGAGIGLAIVWLWSYQFRGAPGVSVFFTSLILMFVAGMINILCATGMTGFPIPQVIAFAATAFGVLGGLAFAVRFSRKNFTTARLMGMLLLGSLASAGCVILPLFVIVSLTALARGDGFLVILMVITIAISAIAFGMLCYLILLPFVLLALRIGFYRERFYATLRLPVERERPPPLPQGMPDDDRPDTES